MRAGFDKIEQNGIIYKLNEDEKKAYVLSSSRTESDIIIPESITYESTEYVITSILRDAFLGDGCIKSIEFSQNSKIEKIENNAFDDSTIESISIPSSLIELSEGWCCNTIELTSFNISSNNPRYKNYEDKFIIGKSDVYSENFDVLVFCVRNIEIAQIPSFIKYIGSYSFDECYQLRTLEFQSNSQLEIIEKQAFSYASITNLKIPPHLTRICELAFCNCGHLQTIEIPENSELRTIEKNAFSFSSIENFFIPSKLIELKEGWMTGVNKLTSISVSPNNPCYKLYDNKFLMYKSDSEKDNYDCLVFCNQNVENLKIPNFIKHIGQFAFNGCNKLKKIEFESNSELQTIGIDAFSDSSIEYFTIPSSLIHIGERAFHKSKLKRLEIPSNSNLRIIDKYAFSECPIENFTIPSKLVELNEGWCGYTKKLNNISVSSNNPNFIYIDNKFIVGKTDEKNSNFDLIVFARRDIESATIPSFIKEIGQCSFDQCNKLHTIEIPPNSELQKINKYAFTFSSIECFTISCHLTEIGASAFQWCRNLRKIKISKNSELKIIGNDAFTFSSIESFTIPSSLIQICEGAFCSCIKLRKIKIQPNSNLQKIDKYAFSETLIESLVIPSTVSYIGDLVFHNCEKLQIIEFDENPNFEFFDLSVSFFAQNQIIIMSPLYHFSKC